MLGILSNAFSTSFTKSSITLVRVCMSLVTWAIGSKTLINSLAIYATVLAMKFRVCSFSTSKSISSVSLGSNGLMPLASSPCNAETKFVLGVLKLSRRRSRFLGVDDAELLRLCCQRRQPFLALPEEGQKLRASAPEYVLGQRRPLTVVFHLRQGVGELEELLLRVQAGEVLDVRGSGGPAPL